MAKEKLLIDKTELVAADLHIKKPRVLNLTYDRITGIYFEPVEVRFLVFLKKKTDRIRVAYRGGSYQLRDAVRRNMMEAALPLVNNVIAAGIEEKVFFTRFPQDIGDLILQLFANMNDAIAAALAGGNVQAALGDILAKLEAYRASRGKTAGELDFCLNYGGGCCIILGYGFPRPRRKEPPWKSTPRPGTSISATRSSGRRSFPWPGSSPG